MKKIDAKHILVVGSGSVGKRHARNFSALGCKISCVDPRLDRLDDLRKETLVVEAYETLELALSSHHHFDGVAICSPPNAHVSQSIAAIAAGIPVLLEKPVSTDIESARRLEVVALESGVPLLLGYTWRWWMPLRRVRELLEKKTLGDLFHVQFHMSAHLADWHPWEPYQNFFMASSALGGGALLDESHWIDLALWLFGMPNNLTGNVDKLSHLEIDSDDNVDVLMAYSNHLRVSLHLDIFGRPHEKFIRFIGEKGSMVWTVEPNQIVVGTQMAGWEQTEKFTCERNDMFNDVAKEFLALLNGDNRELTCTLADGLRVLDIVSAVRESSATGQKIYFNDVDTK
jgi:predicted dehydrogenase